MPLALLPGWLRSRAGSGALVLGAGLLAALLLVGRCRSRCLPSSPDPPAGQPVLGALGRTRSTLLRTTLESIAALDGPRLVRLMALTTAIWLASAAVMQAMLIAFRIQPIGARRSC